jgi:hypothetical protein
MFSSVGTKFYPIDQIVLSFCARTHAPMTLERKPLVARVSSILCAGGETIKNASCEFS